ncbi:MAG: hypothetical protein ABR523_04275 [Desulfurivibrionaceae bacterium]
MAFPELLCRREKVGAIEDKYIFLCGPSPMTDSLIKQFSKIGVPAEQIVVEDFNLL